MYGVDDNGIKASRTSKSAEEIAKAYLDAVPKRMILANALEAFGINAEKVARYG